MSIRTLPICPHLDESSSPRDRGQATAEYALIILAAALIALAVVSWAGGGGATGRIGDLFDAVIDRVTSQLP